MTIKGTLGPAPPKIVPLAIREFDQEIEQLELSETGILGFPPAQRGNGSHEQTRARRMKVEGGFVEFGVIEWYYNEQIHDTLGFYPFKSGFYIIGGSTGSHHSGYGERVEGKKKELRAKGYVTIQEAIEKGVVSADWQPPKIKNRQDRRIIAHIDKVEGYFRYQDLKPWWVY